MLTSVSFDSASMTSLSKNTFKFLYHMHASSDHCQVDKLKVKQTVCLIKYNSSLTSASDGGEW
jgi:hypothetical protein